MVLGLHPIDALVVVLYVVGIVWVGLRLQKKLRDTEDFYLGGRKLGRFYQFFVNFGTATDAGQASTVCREIYRQGMGGMWIQYLVIWLTPFYWFTSMMFRRVRLVTVGDFFTDRYRSKFLAGAYAVFMLVMGVVGGGGGFLVAGKMMEAITPIPYERLDPARKAVIDDYREYRKLGERRDAGLSADEEARYRELENLAKQKQLRAFYSYVDLRWFYLIYGLVVAAYTMLGGFTAAAITDAIQGILIIAFSLVMIPFGLSLVGGFPGLHATVPDYMFHLFGGEVTSEYTLGMVAAMTFAQLVSIIAVAHGMGISGSARTEATARFGVLTGMFFKRIVMIGWALIGILAFALFAGVLHDPDLAWGHMSNELLSFVPGLIGLMLVGILAANMSTLDTGSVAYSALFIKNLYEPVSPGRSERHYVNVGRVVILVALAGGAVVALAVDNLMVLFKYFIALPAVFGGAIWLGFLWRRVTRWAVIVQVVVCALLYAVVPNVVPAIPALARSEALHAETEAREVVIPTGALQEDVRAGRAARVGEVIEKTIPVKPAPIYFSRIVTVEEDGREVRTGEGRFNAEVWVMSLLGMDFRDASKADLETTRFLFSGLAPFVLLVLLSLLTRPVAAEHLDRFFAKMHTRSRSDPEEDRKALEAAYADPERIAAGKLFGPRSSFEFGRPTWLDAAGFFGSWVVVGLIIALLYLVTRLGAPGISTSLGVALMVGTVAAIAAILHLITSIGKDKA